MLIADYSSLYAKIGTLYGDNSADPTKFKLPDLRGYFIRGMVPDTTNSDGTTKPGVRLGAVQQDTMQKIIGSFVSIDHNNNNANTSTGAFTIASRWSTNFKSGSGDDWGTTNNFDSSKVIRTDAADETRPKNVSMLFAIRAF